MRRHFVVGRAWLAVAVLAATGCAEISPNRCDTEDTESACRSLAVNGNDGGRPEHAPRPDPSHTQPTEEPAPDAGASDAQDAGPPGIPCTDEECGEGRRCSADAVASHTPASAPGACVAETCTAFPQTGCKPDEYCYPGGDGDNTGTCMLTGTKPPGAVCGYANDCRRDYVCAGSTAPGHCLQLCNPVIGGRPSCPTGVSCVGLGGQPGVGVCI